MIAKVRKCVGGVCMTYGQAGVGFKGRKIVKKKLSRHDTYLKDIHDIDYMDR